MTKNERTGHLASLITIFIWGTTFISTKLLLDFFTPMEILFFRFLLGFLALLFLCPRRLGKTTAKEELTLAAAGLCGICLYYLLENMALTFTLASNVGVIISAAPFFTAILSRALRQGRERLGPGFFPGFVISMTGICLISLGGSSLKLNPRGDFLALLAALVWAFYSVLTRRIGLFGYQTILTTRRTFFYGLLFMVPALFFLPFHPEPQLLARPLLLGNLLFLGLGASALCFVTWNTAVKILGAVKTSVYIYMVPVITVITSALILREPVTPLSAAGTALTLTGLFLSEYRKKT